MVVFVIGVLFVNYVNIIVFWLILLGLLIDVVNVFFFLVVLERDKVLGWFVVLLLLL